MKEWSNNTQVIILYALFVVFMIITISCKKDFHVDELLSYDLANHMGGFHLQIDKGITYEQSDLPYKNWLAVDGDNRFQYENVWKNQTDDVHPVLYYILLHTICSVFPNTFSIWYAAIINICFAVITLFFYRKIINLFMKDNRTVLLSTVFFVSSVGILSAVSFLRMYIMAMCFVTITAYLFLDAVFKEKLEYKFYILLFLASVLGALTHYYCIVYLFFVSIIFGVWLLTKHRWKEVVYFVFAEMFAAGTSIGIFPAMVSHMFSGYRGEESLANLTELSFAEYLTRIKTFFEIIDNQLFGGGLLYFIVGIILMLLAFDKWIKRVDIQYLILLIPCICYFILVSRMAVYVTDRYIFPIYALLLAFITVIIVKVIEGVFALNKIGYFVMTFIMAGLIVGTWKKADWAYLYLSSQERLEQAKTHGQLNAVMVYDSNDTIWKTEPAYKEISNYNSITFYKSDEMELMDTYTHINDKELICLIIGNDENILETIKQKLPYIDRYEKVSSFAYHTTYRLYGDGRNCIIQTFDKSGYLAASVDINATLLITDEPSDFYVIPALDSYYLILNNGKAIDVKYGNFSNGTEVQTYAVNGSKAQNWRFIENSDGSYSIEASDGRFCLAYDDDGNIYLSEKSGNNSEKWWIELN